MARIGTVDVAVRAQTSQFSKGLNKATSRLKTFAKFAAGIAAGISFRNVLRDVDQIAKFADRIGIATENLVGLQHAAEITGVSTRNLQLGLQRMTRRLAEAAQGTGEAKKAVAELGLDAAALVKLAPDQQFAAVAEAMKGVGSQSDRVRLAMRLFDTEGVALVNTLALGKDGLEAMQKEAERLGITFTRGEASKIEEFNDAVTRLKGSFGAVVREITIALAPALTRLADTLGGLIGKFKGIAAAAISSVSIVTRAFQGGADAVSRMGFSSSELRFGERVGSGVAGVLEDAKGPFAGQARAFAKHLRRMVRDTKREREAIEEQSRMGANAPDPTPMVLPKLSEFDDAMDKAKSKIDAAKASADSFGSTFASALEQIIFRVGSLSDALKNLGMSLLRSTISGPLTGLGSQLGNMIFGVNVNSAATASQGILNPNVARAVAGTVSGVGSTQFASTPGANS